MVAYFSLGFHSDIFGRRIAKTVYLWGPTDHPPKPFSLHKHVHYSQQNKDNRLKRPHGCRDQWLGTQSLVSRGYATKGRDISFFDIRFSLIVGDGKEFHLWLSRDGFAMFCIAAILSMHPDHPGKGLISLGSITVWEFDDI